MTMLRKRCYGSWDEGSVRNHSSWALPESNFLVKKCLPDPMDRDSQANLKGFRSIGWNKNRTGLMGLLWALNQLIYVKQVEQGWEQNKG